MLYLATKQLLARKKQSLFILLGIILGSAAYVVISGFMLGFQQYLLEKLVNNMPQITISAKQQFITPAQVTHNLFSHQELVHWLTPPSGVRELDYIVHPQGWYSLLKANQDVAAYVPQLTGNALINNGALSESVSLIGTIAQQQIKVTSIGHDITQGDFLQLKPGSRCLVLGSKLAKRLGVVLHNTVNVVNQQGQQRSFRACGIFTTGTRGTDSGVVYMDLTDLQSLLGKLGLVNTIAVKVNRPYQADKIANTWQSFSIDKVESWQQMSQNILSVFTVQDFVRYTMVITILLVSAFGIYNVLNIMVNQKRKEIAILRAIGYTARDIVKLFFIQGILLGIIGGLLGLLTGWLICLYIASLPAIGPSAATDSKMIIAFNISIYGKAMLMALIAAVVASIIPARAAGRLKPIAIIRSEAVE